MGLTAVTFQTTCMICLVLYESTLVTSCLSKWFGRKTPSSTTPLYSSTTPPYSSTTPPYSSTTPSYKSSTTSFINETDVLERTSNMSESKTSPWCESSNSEQTPGSQEDSLADRMVSGHDTIIDRHPHQLALEGGGSHICGGSILSEYWALTAAHCVYDQPGKWLAFRAGSSQREEGGTVHHVKYYVHHEKFTMESLDYDVAVVFVQEPFRYDKRTLPITLPSHPYNGGVNVEATGWGYKQRTLLTKPRKLQSADFVTLDWGTCRSRYPGQITKRMICAEDPSNIADICRGDSGGALVLRGTRKLVGIVSWSHACADGLPSVYTDVFSVVPWIRKSVGTAKDNLCN